MVLKAHYINAFVAQGLILNRMISYSKSAYVRRHPDNLVAFNANVLTEKSGKIWFGDLDVTKDADDLQKIANSLGEELFILRESDFRFKSEETPINEAINLAIVSFKPKISNDKKSIFNKIITLFRRPEKTTTAHPL